jgi:hypothetical protein
MNSFMDINEAFTFVNAQDNMVNGVKEDMGLSAQDNLLMDEHMSDEDLALLNMEVTPEIEDILIKAVFAHSLKEISTWEEGKADREAAYQASVSTKNMLNQLIEVQEGMDRTMNVIRKDTKKRDLARTELDQWVKRYNNWKDSDAYRVYKHKDQAAKIFFTGLELKKNNYQALKGSVQNLWDTWNTLKSQSDEIVEGNEFLWVLYYQLAESEINTYFTNGDVEDVDDFRLLANTQSEVMDLIDYTHSIEMAEYDRVESKGQGFWSYSNENKVTVSNKKRVSNREDMDSLMAMIDQMAA